MLPLGHVRHARRDQRATVLMLTCAGGYTYAVKFCNGLICLSRFVCHGAVQVDSVLFTVLVDFQNPDEDHQPFLAFKRTIVSTLCFCELFMDKFTQQVNIHTMLLVAASAATGACSPRRFSCTSRSLKCVAVAMVAIGISACVWHFACAFQPQSSNSLSSLCVSHLSSTPWSSTHNL